jgi:hypothetical protein
MASTESLTKGQKLIVHVKDVQGDKILMEHVGFLTCLEDLRPSLTRFDCYSARCPDPFASRHSYRALGPVA